MDNRLELNWKLDGFVDEQRYYRSDTPIDVNALPVPTEVLTGDSRSHSDTDIVYGKTYRVRIGSVKNNTEKISNEVVVDTLSDKAVALLYFDTNLIDKTGNGVYSKTDRAFLVNDTVFNEPALKISGSIDSVTTSNDAVWQFTNQDFCIEFPMLALDITTYQAVLSKWQASPTSASEILLSLYQGSLYFDVRSNDGSSYIPIFNVDAAQLLQKTQITLEREGSEFRLWFGNTIKAEVSIDVVINTANSTPFRIGGNESIGVPFNGYIGKMRVIKGASRYSLSNSPPQVANY